MWRMSWSRAARRIARLVLPLLLATGPVGNAAAEWNVNRTELATRTAVGSVLYDPRNTDDKFTGVGLFCDGRRPTFYIYGGGMPNAVNFLFETDGIQERIRLNLNGDATWTAPVAPDTALRIALARSLRGSTDGGRNWNAVEMTGAQAAVRRALAACT
jgi:hypothetical protein